MALQDTFRPLLDKYPPDYKLLKTQLVADFANPHEGVWNALHLELLTLEFLAIVCQSKSKPKVVVKALAQALEDAQDSWSHVYQQLRNATDDLDFVELRKACADGGVYPPMKLERDRVAVERLGNAMLERMGRMGGELQSQNPAQVAAGAIRQGLRSLDEKHLTLATTCAAFVDLRDRLAPKLTPLEKTQGDAPKRKGLMAVVAALAVLVLSLGVYVYLARDQSTASEAFSAAKAHYQAGEFSLAVENAESAIDKYKAEGAGGPEIHKVRKFLGSAYYKVGDVTAAIEQLQILVKAYPDNQEYRQTLAQLQSEK